MIFFLQGHLLFLFSLAPVKSFRLLLFAGCLFGLNLFFPGFAQAQQTQKQIMQQTIAWYRLEQRIDFSSAWRLSLETEYRPFNFTGNRFQYYVRGRVHYRFNEHWRMGLGAAYFRQTNHQPHVKGNLDVPEIRFHQELTFQSIPGKWQTVHQVRIEERFFRNSSGSDLVDGYRFNFRFRYRLEFIRALIQPETETGSLRLRTHGEVMLNAGEPIIYNFFDQIRFYLGLNYQVSRPWAIELGYMKSFQQRESGYQYLDRDIVRIALQHQWRLK
jgi:hypothetical protein